MTFKNLSLKSICCATALCATSALKAQVEEQPNLLFIFPDQYRMNALSLWSDPEFRDAIATVGDPVSTPNIDKLGREGVVFTQATSTHPLSSPQRAMLFSGMYPSQNGVEGMNCHVGRPQGLHTNIETFTDVIAKADYETAYVGKTHWYRNEALFDEEYNYVGTKEAPGGHSANPYDTYIPEGRGRLGNKFWFQQFDDVHFNAKTYSNRPELVNGNKDGEPFFPKRFTTEVEADVIIKYLDNKNKERDASKPFSLIWAINPPHNPYSRISDCREEVFNKYYKALDFKKVLLRANAKSGEGTSYADEETLLLTAKVYFSLIKSVDDEIGRVLNSLEENGLDKNTIVVFTSDHGEQMGSQGGGGKNCIYDESFLVPFIVRYPGKIKPHTTDLLLGSTDIMPTVLSLMGLEKEIPASVMGLDYADGLVTGNFVKNAKPVSALYLNYREKGVRTDRYTYLVKSNGDYVLFDNANDPFQLNPIALEDIEPSQVALLRSELGKWLTVSKDGWASVKKYANRIDYPSK